MTGCYFTLHSFVSTEIHSVCRLAEWLCLLPVGETIAFMDQKHFHMHIKAHPGYSNRLRFIGEEQHFMHQEKKEFSHEQFE